MTRTPSRDNFSTLRALRPVLVTGASVGAVLSLLFSAWVLVANRMPSLERYADLRNAAAAAAFFLVALVPVARYCNSAMRLLMSSTIACGILSLSYFAWSLHFGRLESHMSAFEILVKGVAIYGLAAILIWLGTLLRSARIHHISMQPATRRRSH